MFSIFFVGAGVLGGALLVNSIAHFFGLMNWFEFIKTPQEANVLSIAWLFIGYPFLLGCSAYGMFYLLKVI